MLQCHDINYVVGDRALLSSISLDVRPGEILSILGPNGAGKSTLLRVLSGELSPTSGRVTLDQTPLSSIGPGILASRRAVVPQNSQLTFAFTALEVVLLGISVPGFNRGHIGADTRLALDCLDNVGLLDFANRFYPSLSGGEKQRVQIARAICQLSFAALSTSKSQCLLLDEATANLDIAHQNLVCRLLKSHADAGRAIVLIAHDLNLAAELSTRVALMKDGKIAAMGNVGEVFRGALLEHVYECRLKVDRNPSGVPTVHIDRGL